MIVRYAQWLIRWRFLVLTLSILAVVSLASGTAYITFTNDYRVFFGEDNPQLKAFENLQDTYTKTDNLLFMLEPKSGNVFTPEVLQAVIDLTEAAWQLPYSIRVDSLSNYQHTYAEGDDLTVEDLFSQPQSLSAAQLEHIKNIALNEPLLVQRLISPDASVTGINVIIQLPGVDTTAEVPSVVAPTRALLADLEQRYPEIRFYVTGVVMMNNAFPEASEQDFNSLIPLGFLAIIIGLLLFLRSVTGAVGSVFVIMMSILAAMGTAGWLGIHLTPPSASAPVMILTIAVADCVHLLMTFLHNMRHGMSKNDALVESLRINFHPIFLTSLTTAVGFLSLNFSDAPPFQDLGNITAIGVIYAFALSVVFLPAFIAILPIKATQETSNQQTLMNRLAEFVIRQRTPLLWSMASIIVVFIAFVPQNQLNDLFVEYFDESVRFRHDSDRIAEKLSGLYFIDYSLDSGKTSGVSDPDFQNKVQAFVDWYKQQPEVIHVNSYTDIMKRLNKNMHGDDPSMYTLPNDRALAAQYLLLYEMSLPYGLDLNNQIDIDKAATRITVTIKTITSTEILALEQRANHWLTQNAPELSTQGASPSIMFAHIGQRNIRSMLLGTTIALVLISFILMIALRSWKYGFISLLPNMLPAGVAFGLWAIMNGEIGLSLSAVIGMTLGIVVDDTVHFLSKYLRARKEKQLNAEDAVRYAFSSVGVALFVTTVVLVIGFMILSQSSFKMNSAMGLMTAITIAIALILDFLFLPPLLMKLEDKK